jgi:hypothetical protein
MIEGKEWDELNESVRSLLFKYGFLLPSAWKRRGAKLKYAAGRLFDLYYDAVTRFLQRFSKDAEEGTGPIASWYTATEDELSKEVTDISLLTEYCLLMGYALENLLKGILMAEHPEYFKPDTKITDIRSHNLVSLCERCSLQITVDEEELLKKLTDHIEWVGKYPVPLELSGMYPRRKPDGTWDGPGNKLNGQATKKMVESLYKRFWDELSLREKSE